MHKTLKIFKTSELVILDDMKNLVPVEVSQYLIREITVKYDTFENGTR